MWKLTSAILLVLLVASNAWWLYGAIDQAVTQKYQDQERYEREQQVSNLLPLANALLVGKSVAQARQIFRQLLPEEVMFEKEGYLHAGFISAKLNSAGAVERVEVNP